MAFSKILFSFLFSTLLLTGERAFAEASESDKLCSYIHKLESQYDQSTNKKAIKSLGKHLGDVLDFRSEAIKKKMTFEEFKELLKKKISYDLSENYRGVYLKFYLNRYCGKSVTEAGVDTLPIKPGKQERISSFSKQLKVEEHSYYKVYKSGPAVK